MIVAVGLFTVVMMISIGSLLSLLHASRKAQSIEAVVDNLNVAVDSMARAIRLGSEYHCGGGLYSVTQDCREGDSTVAFLPNGKDVSSPRTVYHYNAVLKRIERSVDSGVTWVPITASNVSITSAAFYVVGSDHSESDNVQPKVIIDIQGSAGIEGDPMASTFHVQASAVQRLLDI